MKFVKYGNDLSMLLYACDLYCDFEAVRLSETLTSLRLVNPFGLLVSSESEVITAVFIYMMLFRLLDCVISEFWGRFVSS